ncbi:hypothetical protein C8T65DRAFT_55937 [Cerioporus squamosus]|nr:hypothetical protein C8T65DRAFT_55937 [Cerioporus squamosus]
MAPLHSGSPAHLRSGAQEPLLSGTPARRRSVHPQPAPRSGSRRPLAPLAEGPEAQAPPRLGQVQTTAPPPHSDRAQRAVSPPRSDSQPSANQRLASPRSGNLLEDRRSVSLLRAPQHLRLVHQRRAQQRLPLAHLYRAAPRLPLVPLRRVPRHLPSAHPHRAQPHRRLVSLPRAHLCSASQRVAPLPLPSVSLRPGLRLQPSVSLLEAQQPLHLASPRLALRPPPSVNLRLASRRSGSRLVALLPSGNHQRVRRRRSDSLRREAPPLRSGSLLKGARRQPSDSRRRALYSPRSGRHRQHPPLASLRSGRARWGSPRQPLRLALVRRAQVAAPSLHSRIRRPRGQGARAQVGAVAAAGHSQHSPADSHQPSGSRRPTRHLVDLCSASRHLAEARAAVRRRHLVEARTAVRRRLLAAGRLLRQCSRLSVAPRTRRLPLASQPLGSRPARPRLVHHRVPQHSLRSAQRHPTRRQNSNNPRLSLVR